MLEIRSAISHRISPNLTEYLVCRDVTMSKASAMMYVPMAQRHVGFSKPTVAVGFCTPRRCLVMMAAFLVTAVVVIQCLFTFRSV